MTPLVSFLTPAYNAEKYLGETIQSVLAQTYERIELIIVNDGSKDSTQQVAKSFGDSRVRVIDQENRGQSASENVAFAACQGELVVHLDADDLVSPNKVEVQVRQLREAEPGCVSFHPWGRFHSDPSETKIVPEPFWRDIDPVDFHVEMWERHSMIQGGCYLIPRSLMDAAGPWDESLSLINDFDFFPRVLLRAKQLLFCSEPLLRYRSGVVGALSQSRSDRSWNSAFRSLHSGTALLLSRENTPRVRRAACRELEEFVYACYPAVRNLRRQAWDRVRELGGPYFRPQMGRRMRAVSRFTGWKLARRIERLFRKAAA